VSRPRTRTPRRARELTAMCVNLRTTGRGATSSGWKICCRFEGPLSGATDMARAALSVCMRATGEGSMGSGMG
jgi:hypothetical protein